MDVAILSTTFKAHEQDRIGIAINSVTTSRASTDSMARLRALKFH